VLQVYTADNSPAIEGEVTYITGSIAEAAVGAPTYFDGSSPYGKWSGTIGASTSTVAAANAVATVSVTVERRVAGGEWVRLVSGVPLPNDIIDLLPVTHGNNEYRISAVSATPTYKTVTVNVLGTDGGEAFNGRTFWVFVNYGDGFSKVLRFRGQATSIGSSFGRMSGTQHFLGKAQPVLLLGENTNNIISAGGTLSYSEMVDVGDDLGLDSPPTDWLTAATTAETVCYRDYTGRRMFGMLSDVSVDEGIPGFTADLSLNVEQTSYTEVYG
jgi:hypothetical protein